MVISAGSVLHLVRVCLIEHADTFFSLCANHSWLYPCACSLQFAVVGRLCVLRERGSIGEVDVIFGLRTRRLQPRKAYSLGLAPRFSPTSQYSQRLVVYLCSCLLSLSLTRVTKSYLLALGTTQISSYFTKNEVSNSSDRELPRDMFRFKTV